MPDTYTSNYNLVKPEPGQSQDTWGTKLNSDLDAIDGQMKANQSAAAAAQAAADAALPKAGGTMTGDVVLAGPPTADLHPATRKWVADALNLLLPKAGGTMTGALSLAGAPSAELHAATKQYVDLQIAANTGTGGVSQAYVDQGDANSRLYTDTKIATLAAQMPSTQNFMTKAGDTMTGFLTLVGNPQQDYHAATKAYTDALRADVSLTLGSFMAKGGGAFTGYITLAGNPTQALHAVTKQYADGLAAGALAAVNNLADVPNKTTALTNLGGSTVGRSVFTAANTGSAQQALGGGTTGRAVFAAGDAAAARSAMGIAGAPISEGQIVTGTPNVTFRGGSAYVKTESSSSGSAKITELRPEIIELRYGTTVKGQIYINEWQTNSTNRGLTLFGNPHDSAKKVGLHLGGFSDDPGGFIAEVQRSGGGQNYLRFQQDGNLVVSENGGTSWSWRYGTSSDVRLKTDIVPITNALAAICRVGGYSYRWIDESKPQERQLGVIAQEVAQIIPEVVADVYGTLTVQYTALVPVLIEAIKELSAKVDELEARVA